MHSRATIDNTTRFPSADYLASWVGVAPGTYERTGQRTSGKARKANRFLRITVVQAAYAAARAKGIYRRAQDRCLAARRGKKRATLAVAPSILVMVYYLFQRRESYHDAGG